MARRRGLHKIMVFQIALLLVGVVCIIGCDQSAFDRKKLPSLNGAAEKLGAPAQ